jgi:uncharacterized cupin superfamily protein
MAVATGEILVSRTNLELISAPIRPEWILEGRPTARNLVLSQSRDGGACTLLWDCTAGVFNWFYDTDETIHILEGEVLLTDANGTRRIGAGDVVFFPAGSSATWRVEQYVRKLAFFRFTMPRPVVLGVKGWRKAWLLAAKVATAVGGRRAIGVTLAGCAGALGVDNPQGA